VGSVPRGILLQDWGTAARSLMVTEVHGREGVFSEIRTAVRHAAVYGLGNVLAKAIGFLMLPFYTHYLVPADYGLLEILDLSFSLLGMVFYMGISPALLRSYAVARSPEEKKTLVSSAFLFMLATGVVIFAIGLGWVRPASNLLFGPKMPSYYLLLSFASFAVTYVTNLPARARKVGRSHDH
jgi:O-antigen/teichoic acid export membrane protein